MFSKTVVKLIDQAILPAILIISAKIISTFLLSLFFSSNYQILTKGFLFIFPVIKYTSYQDYFKINSYSNSFMFATVALGVIYVLIKAHFLHQSHIDPIFQAKISRARLSRTIASSFHLYHQAAVWLIFLWLVTALLVFEATFKISSQMLAVFAGIFAINSTWFLIVDVEHEVEIWQHRNV